MPPDEGTTVAARAARRSDQEPAAGAAGAAGSVLIVDDDATICHVLRRDLGVMGYACQAATDGRTALELLARKDFDVALIDLLMPEVSGLDVLRGLQERRADTVPVILSGQKDIAEAVEATKLGAFDFIEKPAPVDVLRRTIDRALKHRQVLRQARALAERAEQWEAAFDASPDMILVLDPDGRILRANLAAARRVGLPKADLAGRACHEAFCGEDHPSAACPLLRPPSRGGAGEAALRAWGGFYEIISRPLTDGAETPWGWLHIVRDVTQRRRAEDDLRDAHAQNELMISSISSILICLDGGGTITQWNAAAEKALGVPVARAVGRILPDIGIPWDYTPVRDAISQCILSDAPVRADDVRFRRPDGKDGFISLTLNPMRSKRREHSGILILGRDITQRRMLESQLAHAQKLEGIGQLAAGIAHEINTPMQYVGDNTRFLDEAFADLVKVLAKYRQLLDAAKSGPISPELVADVAATVERVDVDYLAAEVPQAIRQSLEGVERITRIVRAMREFSHPGVERKVAVDLNHAIESTITVCRNEWRYVAETQTDFDGSLPPVLCLPGELNQVILNLIINAVHTIQDKVGDGSAGKGTIGISTRRDGDWVEIRLSDTGLGIPEGVRSRVFDPFFTTKKVGRGTGQGLAISRSVIVDKHGGTIDFETEMGRGTTFIVRLPIDPAAGRNTNQQAGDGANASQEVHSVRG